MEKREMQRSKRKGKERMKLNKRRGRNWKEKKEKVKEKTAALVMRVFTLCELGGRGHRNAIEWTRMSAGVQSHDPASVLDDAVLSLDAGPLDGYILRHDGVITADTRDSCNITDTWEIQVKWNKIKGILHVFQYVSSPRPWKFRTFLGMRNR